MAQEIVKSDGRGIIAGDYVNQNHPMDRDQWLRDSFPEWGTLLNQQIESRKVPKGSEFLRDLAFWICSDNPITQGLRVFGYDYIHYAQKLSKIYQKEKFYSSRPQE
jgi:hypothetical protein